MTNTEADLCSLCPHPFDPHSVIATTGEAMEGGIVLCPVEGCQCYATWGVNGAQPIRVPDQVETDALRTALQEGRL